MVLGVGRVQKEIKQTQKTKHLTGITIKLCEDNDSLHLCASIGGPAGTPYEEGTFQIDIRVPENYPFAPPKMQFITKVWHPNISSANGAICLDTLKDNWSAALTLNTTLLSLQALLSAPEPNDPLDAVVAGQYLSDNEAFVSTARYWTRTFAMGEDVGIMEQKVQRLVDMGFPVDLVRTVFENCGGDENMALEELCSKCKKL